MRIKSWLAKIGLLAGSSVVALAVAEAFLRLLYPAPYHGYEYVPPQRQLFRYDALVGWSGRPGATGRFASIDFDVRVTQDERGFRNSTPAHVPGRENLLVVGDSYGWGWGVEDDETCTARMSASGDRLNAYNLSAPGYGTDQQLLTLRRFLKQADGAEYAGVFLLFYHNDFQDVLETTRYGYPKPRFVLEGGSQLEAENLPVPRRKRSEFDRPDRPHERLGEPSSLERLHVHNLARYHLRRARNALQAEPPDSNDAGSGAEAVAPRYDLPLTLAILDEIQALCERHGMFFHVIFLKVGGLTPSIAYEKMDELADDLAGRGIDHSVFHRRTLPSTDLWLDGHLSPYGHTRLAEHLLDVVGDVGERSP